MMVWRSQGDDFESRLWDTKSELWLFIIWATFSQYFYFYLSQIFSSCFFRVKYWSLVLTGCGETGCVSVCHWVSRCVCLYKTGDLFWTFPGGPGLPVVPVLFPWCHQCGVMLIVPLTSLSHLRQVSWCTLCTAGSPAQTWICVETWGGCKLTPLSPLEPGVTWSGSLDTSSAQPGCVLAVCLPPCSMADAGAWRTHQDGPQIIQPGPGPGPGLGPGPTPNRVWISLIAGEILSLSH